MKNKKYLLIKQIKTSNMKQKFLISIVLLLSISFICFSQKTETENVENDETNTKIQLVKVTYMKEHNQIKPENSTIKQKITVIYRIL